MLASGAASPALARPLGIRLPIYPLKGYSITVPASAAAPAISITDFKRKVVYAPLSVAQGAKVGSAPATMIRIAGMADIVGRSPAIDPERLEQLVVEAEAAFPDATTTRYARDALAPWSGQRPATPEGTPILGATPIANLFLDVGHGALGWTLALGSGKVVADVIAGRAPRVPLAGMSLA